MKRSALIFPISLLALASLVHAEPKEAKKSPPVPAPAPLDPATSKAIPVLIDGAEFTKYIYQGVPKPVLFPIVGPYGLEMTRNWPLRTAKAGEELDHPHHQSLWFAHGDINGVDFWTIGEKAGKVTVQGEPKVEVVKGETTITSSEIWSGPDGKQMLTSQTKIHCAGDKDDRIIDYTITLNASDADLVFGDTKEGTMALRVRPELNLPNKKGVAVVTNSGGETGQGVWGKKAAWVDYSAVIEGKSVGIAAFDHPSNFRHPSTWHARDYGLFAANPFGLHDFEKAPAGTGKHTLKKGESLTFRYRWLFHAGDAKAADVAGKFTQWTKEK